MKLNLKNNIIAHRGVFNNEDIPENSIMAFKKAIKLGYAVEFDVQLTIDNVLVVFHDENLCRMTGVNKNIQELTYKEIKKYKLLDTNQYIPTLEEVLDIVGDKVLMDIEIKDTKRIKETCNMLMSMIEKYNNYILKSFNPKIVRYLKNNYKDEKVGYLINSKYKEKILNIILPSICMIKYSKADFLAINKKLLKTKKFQKLSKKYPLLLWTIKDKNEIVNDEHIYICNNLC